MKWIPYGPRAALVEMPVAAAAALAGDPSSLERLKITEVTPAPSRTLLEFVAGTNLEDGVKRAMVRAATLADKATTGRLVEVPFTSHGEDFMEACQTTGLEPEEFIARFCGREYVVAMMGFAPGFAYLDGLDPLLHLPRRPVPRARIEAGSVAIGGPHAGIYSIPSPGGWNLLGRTSLRIFHPEKPADQVFLLRVGDRIRFVAHRP